MTDSNLDIIRTQEDLINAVSVLYFNLMEIERIYYDMFINTTPMDITFQRYDDLGVLGTITLPNRAKDVQIIVTGSVNPNGNVEAKAGVFYLDTSSTNLYYKSTSAGKEGWVNVLDVNNFVEGEQYLRPDGNGSQLSNLNANNITGGVLSVERGGTGTGSIISGLIKGGANAFSAATDGEDYLGPSSFVGIICFYPIAAIPEGWLFCDGTPKRKETYSRLYARIGDAYGIPTEAEIHEAYPDEQNINVNEWFKIPMLRDYFIRCWDGSSAFNRAEEGQVGKHTHGVNFTSGKGSAHRHESGNNLSDGYNITGAFPALETVYKSGYSHPDYGAFSLAKRNVVNGNTINNKWDNNMWKFNAKNTWTGKCAPESSHTHSISGNTAQNTATVKDGENIVKNYQLVPMIKY